MRPPLTRRALLGVLGASGIAWGRDWEKPAFPDWSGEFTDRLLTDSPWARPVDVPFVYQPRGSKLRSDFSQIGLPGSSRLPLPGRSAGPRGNVGVHTEIYLTVRWSSALPIRQALALEQWGRKGLSSPEAQEFLAAQTEEHLLEVFGIPATQFPDGTAQLEKDMERSGSLLVKDRMPVRASSAAAPAPGMHLSVALRFPRLEGLSETDNAIDFEAKAGPMRIAARFKLKDMVYGGRLAV
ncbi:MAG: hypothetical protein R2762_09295 [Bryobacteraceae bacterium]